MNSTESKNFGTEKLQNSLSAFSWQTAHPKLIRPILASKAAYTGNWLNSSPITSIGLRMSNETILVAIDLRLEAKLCEPHQCTCGALVDARGLHGHSCRRSACRHAKHSLLNNTIWHAMNKAGVQSTKEPTGLLRSDGKRPDGVTLILWAKGRCLAWDLTVPDTFATSYNASTSYLPGLAAEHAATLKKQKYTALSQTHEYVPLAIKTSGVFNSEGLEFVKKIGGRLSNASSDEKETAYLFQRIAVTIKRGNSISFSGSFEQVTIRGSLLQGEASKSNK